MPSEPQVTNDLPTSEIRFEVANEHIPSEHTEPISRDAKLSKLVAIAKNALEINDHHTANDALQRLYTECAPLVHNMVNHRLKSAVYDGVEATSDDITLIAFSKAFTKLHTFKNEARFLPWLMTIATRVCYDFIRKSRAEKRGGVDTVSIETLQSITLDDILTLEIDSRNSVLTTENDYYLRKAINQLNKKHRAILLEFLEGSTEKAVSRKFSVSVDSVRGIKKRAIDKLKEYISKARLDSPIHAE